MGLDNFRLFHWKVRKKLRIWTSRTHETKLFWARHKIKTIFQPKNWVGCFGRKTMHNRKNILRQNAPTLGYLKYGFRWFFEVGPKSALIDTPPLQIKKKRFSKPLSSAMTMKLPTFYFILVFFHLWSIFASVWDAKKRRIYFLIHVTIFALSTKMYKKKYKIHKR